MQKTGQKKGWKKMSTTIGNQITSDNYFLLMKATKNQKKIG